MLASPFAFYRGAAYLMAADLASTPRSGINVQVCGDAHVSNFGLFGSPERELLFDINDFDETLPGPWEWDVKRLAASLAVAGRNNGFRSAERGQVITASVGEYRTAMREFASMRNLDVWYSRLQVREGLSELQAVLRKKDLKEAGRLVDKARTRDSIRAFDKLTHLVDGEPRIVSDPPLIVPVEELLTADQAATFVERLHGLRTRIVGACSGIAGTSWRTSVSSTWRTRWSGWAASAPVRGSSSCSVAMTPIRSSSRPRRRRLRCSLPSSARVVSRIRVSEWWRARG
jgi:hypothetical protein